MQTKARTLSIALLLISLSAATGAAQPAADASATEPVAALDGGSILADHCGQNESRIDYGDTHYCQYNPPCDGTCTSTQTLIAD